VGHDGEVLEAFVTKKRDKSVALKFLKKLMRRHGRAEGIVTDGAPLPGAALKGLGAEGLQVAGRWAKQPGWKLAPAIPTTRAGHVAVPSAALASETLSRSTTCSTPSEALQPLEPQAGPHRRLAEWRQLCAQLTSGTPAKSETRSHPSDSTA
jgi:hypothetical protein